MQADGDHSIIEVTSQSLITLHSCYQVHNYMIISDNSQFVVKAIVAGTSEILL